MTVLGDRYELGEALGSGGMAQVVRAHDRVLGRDVAVKLFGPGIDPNGPVRARGEVRTLAALSHPNLVVVHDAGTDTEHVPPRAYLVMQLIDGPSLADLLKDGPLPDSQVRHLGEGVAQALAYVHDRGVVHRDIKPGNVLVDDSGRPYLADFGIAQHLGAAALTAAGVTVGTASYLSPEQVRGGDVGPASDVFGFGLVLLEALTGECEYSGTTAETALARLSRPPAIAGRVPDAWRDLLTAMTDLDPAARPSAAEVARVLASLPPGSSGRSPTGTRVLPVKEPTVALDQRTAVLAPSAAAPTRQLQVRALPPPRVPLRATRRKPFPARPAAMAVAAVVFLSVAVLGITHRLSPAGSQITPAPTGTPGLSRLDADLSRLQQLVKP